MQLNDGWKDIYGEYFCGKPKKAYSFQDYYERNIWHKDTTTTSVMESDYETETSSESSDTISYSYETSDDEGE